LLVLLGTSTPTGVAPCSGTITGNTTGGVAPYIYSLNGGAPQASNFFATLCPGTYTLEVTDANGCVRVYITTIQEAALSIDNLTFNGTVNIYPNPSQGVLHIDIESGELLGALDLQIYNVIGQSIYKTNFTSTTNSLKETINLGTPAKGIYTLVITDVHNRKYIKKVVIE
jgi:hypothetical protein